MSNQENQFMKKRMTVWRLWCKALGEKAGKNDREADHIAHIRTFIFFTYLITNIFICAGVIRHWNDETKIEVFVETSAPDYQTPPLMKMNRTLEFE